MSAIPFRKPIVWMRISRLMHLMSYYLPRYIGIFCHSFSVTCVKDLWSSWTLSRLLRNAFFKTCIHWFFLSMPSLECKKSKSKIQSKRFKCPEVETQLRFSYHFLFVVIFDFFSKQIFSTKLEMKHFLVTGGVRFFEWTIFWNQLTWKACMEASSESVCSSLFKSWSGGYSRWSNLYIGIFFSKSFG